MTDNYKPVCDPPKSREDDDLCQQRRMAQAAEDSVYWSAWQTRIGVAGFIGVILTIGFTGWAAIAAAAAAKAAQRSADVAEDAFHRLERPYLFIKIASTDSLRVVSEHQIAFINYTLVNCGKLPAVLRSVSVDLIDNPKFFSANISARGNTSYEVVEPQGRSRGFNARVKEGIPGKSYKGQESTLYLYGLIRYEDPTGACHSDRFCMRGLRNSEDFKVWGGKRRNYRTTTYPQAPTPDSEPT